MFLGNSHETAHLDLIGENMSVGPHDPDSTDPGKQELVTWSAYTDDDEQRPDAPPLEEEPGQQHYDTEDDPMSLEGTDRRAVAIISASVFIALLLGCWFIYKTNESWWTVFVAILPPLVVSYIIYRLQPEWLNETVLLAVNTAYMVFIFMTRPTVVAVLVAFALLALLIRSIMIIFRGTEREAILTARRETMHRVKVTDRLTLKLDPDERYLLVTRYHVIAEIGWFVSIGAWLVLWYCLWAFTSISTAWALGMLLGGELILVTKPMLWHREYLCLTTHYRLFEMKGVLKRSTPTITVNKLTDVTPTITRLSTILSWMRIIKVPYGYYVLETAGQDQALTKIGPIPAIDAFERVVSQMVTGESRRDPLE